MDLLLPVGKVGCRTYGFCRIYGLSDKWVVGQVGLYGQQHVYRRSRLSEMWVVGNVTCLLQSNGLASKLFTSVLFTAFTTYKEDFRKIAKFQGHMISFGINKDVMWTPER